MVKYRTFQKKNLLSLPAPSLMKVAVRYCMPVWQKVTAAVAGDVVGKAGNRQSVKGHYRHWLTAVTESQDWGQTAESVAKQMVLGGGRRVQSA